MIYKEFAVKGCASCPLGDVNHLLEHVYCKLLDKYIKGDLGYADDIQLDIYTQVYNKCPAMESVDDIDKNTIILNITKAK